MARVYISGGITNVPDYRIRFAEAKTLLLIRGYEVVNPATVCESLPTSFTHEQYMKVCMALLECCDTIYMLNGWGKSKGAQAECEWALFHGLKILTEDKDGEVG